jgi:hypothetical protein
MINSQICSEPRLRKAQFVTLTAALLVVLAGDPSRLAAQVPSTRLVHVTVTDRFGRFVTGLEQKRFEVVEGGVLCPITKFSGADSPMMLVIVSEKSVSEVSALIRPEDELIQARSFPDAIRRLSASKKPRKIILTTVTLSTKAVPDDIQVLETTPANLFSAVDELVRLHEYLLWVMSSTPSANLNVVLKPPPGLPPLSLTWN